MNHTLSLVVNIRPKKTVLAVLLLQNINFTIILTTTQIISDTIKHESNQKCFIKCHNTNLNIKLMLYNFLYILTLPEQSVFTAVLYYLHILHKEKKIQDTNQHASSSLLFDERKTVFVQRYLTTIGLLMTGYKCISQN